MSTDRLRWTPRRRHAGVSSALGHLGASGHREGSTLGRSRGPPLPAACPACSRGRRWRLGRAATLPRTGGSGRSHCGGAQDTAKSIPPAAGDERSREVLCKKHGLSPVSREIRQPSAKNSAPHGRCFAVGHALLYSTERPGSIAVRRTLVCFSRGFPEFFLLAASTVTRFPRGLSPRPPPSLLLSPVRPKRLHLQVLVDNGVAADRQVGAARSSRARCRHRHAGRRGSPLLRQGPRLAGLFVGEPEAWDLEAQLAVRGDTVVVPSPGGVELLIRCIFG